MTQTDKTANVTIGTLTDLGLVGVPLDVACSIMRAWDKAVRGEVPVMRPAARRLRARRQFSRPEAIAKTRRAEPRPAR